VFEYNDIKVDGIKLSPSGLANFFSNPSNWYRDTFTDENTFKGNTGSTIGTIIHGVCESVAKNEPVDREVVEAYIDSIDNEDVDKAEVREHWYGMSHALVNEYVLKQPPELIEYQTKCEVAKGIWLAGTIDGVYLNSGGILLDYKSARTKPNTETIPFNYKTQMMAYSYMLKQEGKEINQLRIAYVSRKTKTLPPRVFVVNHIITKEDWDDFDDILKLVVETIQLEQEHPEYRHLLYKSMNLKEK